MIKYIWLIVVIFLFSRCNYQAEVIDTPNTSFHLNDKFKNYWYQGKAEISSYKLQQSRYGEIHEGHAVLVFVTEDFSREKQVKLDDPSLASSDRISVLKLNFIKKFNTGIYPYSMMQSIFTPVNILNFPHSLKTTMSSQEWCGHVFAQLNLDKDQYRMEEFSYFESEGDKKTSLDLVILEDELWNRIRLDPENLPQGKLELIPSLFFTRLAHKSEVPQQANLELKENKLNVMEYTIEYPKLERSLTISFNKEFPHQILGWEETYRSLRFAGGKKMTTKASLQKTLLSPYWRQNKNIHRSLRDSLDLLF